MPGGVGRCDVLTIWPGLRSEQGNRQLIDSGHAGDVLGRRLARRPMVQRRTPARPSGIFCSLFQFLKLFESNPETGELIGGIIIPGGVMMLLFLMPLIGPLEARASLQRRPAGCLLIGIVGVDRAGHVGRSTITCGCRAEHRK